jgi:hypothetical protein
MTSLALDSLLADLAKAQNAVENAMHTATKLEQADWWMEGGKMVVGRHAKAARTRLAKARRERDRLTRRVDDLKARMG